MMKVISLVNRKGGVAKTSLSFHLAGEYARRGSSVLLVDLDPQASLSEMLLGEDAVDQLDVEQTVVAAALDPVAVCVPMGTRITGLEILPINHLAEDVNMPLARLTPHEVQCLGLLRSWLRKRGGEYDRVLIDNAPAFVSLAYVGLVAADFALIPVQAENPAVKGLGRAVDGIRAVQELANEELQLAGIVPTMRKHQRTHEDYVASMMEAYGELVFTASMPDAAAFRKAMRDDVLLPVSHMGRGAKQGQSKEGLAIAAIVDELERRIAAGSDRDTGTVDESREAA